MRNRQASIHNILIAQQQNQMIRRAILATGSSHKFERMRKVYAMILSNNKNAYSSTMDDVVDQLDNPEVKDAVGVSYITEIINKFKEKFKSINKGEIDLIADVLKKQGLTKKLHRLVDAGTKPKTEYERLIASRLKKAGNFSSTLKMMGKLIAARTPQQVAKVSGVGINDLREMMGIDPKDITLTNWAMTKWEDLNKYIAVGVPDHSLIVVKLGVSILKVSAIALLMKTALAVVGAGIVKIIGVVFLVCLLTNTQATAQIVRKLGVSFATLGPAVLKDLAKGFKFLKGVGQSILQGGRSLFKKIFRKAAVQQIQQMLRTNEEFKRAYQYVQLG